MNQFYEQNHQQYFKSTVDIDPAAFLTPLTGFLKPRATILDVGCGSGRDLLWLRQHGFRPTGLEQAPSLARLAREHAGCEVIEADFCHHDFGSRGFCALVFIGSLVHQPRNTVSGILRSTCRSLVPGGHVLITMKEGEGVVASADGRRFTLWAQSELEELFDLCGLAILDFSRQVSKLRPEDIWLGYVLKFVNEA
ncbi:MAG: class I SAM-dependent methyltransferase [Desulfocapsa sp.]|nr:class I SAM-dependent methyltransferase [Desulfocapsa sp.]